jgi:hypothetical protein
MAEEPGWETPFPFKHLDIHYSVQFVSAAEYRVQSTKGLINLQSMTEDGIINLIAGRMVKMQSRNAAIDLFTEGDSSYVSVMTSGPDGFFQVSSPDGANHSGIVVGPSGIEIQNGPAIGPADIQLNSEELRLSIGPPGLGSLLSMTKDSITLQVGPTIKLELAAGTGITGTVGDTSFKATLEGITESVGITERKLNLQGHTLQAAESRWQLNPVGTKASVPLQEINMEASQKEETLLSSVKQIIKKFQGLWMGSQ